MPALVLVASFFLFAVALVLQTWLAHRYAIWGDEWDTIAPSFLKWRGQGKTFWWQIGQYNANPPGDNFILRQYYLSDVFGWLKNLNEEIFWRLPYLLVWGLTCFTAFWGALKYSRSWFFAFFAFCFTLAAPGPLTYATEIRFYIWLVFFMSLCVWQTLATVRAKSSTKEFALLSLFASVGVCFHLMLAAVGYLVLLGGLGLTAYELYQKKKITPKSVAYFIASAIPFTLYKVELKHWLFIPPPHTGASAWSKFRATPWRTFLDAFASNLPLRAEWIIYGIALLTVVLLGVILARIYRKEWLSVIEGGLLVFFFWACPIALFISAAHREYDLLTRHFIFEVPVIAACLVYLGLFAVDILKPVVSRAKFLEFARAAACLILFAGTFDVIVAKARDQNIFSPAKVNYSLPAWRSYFSNLPDRKPLVIVGTRPDRYHYGSDLGTYMAGMFSNYARPFTPIYYSKHGVYSSLEALDPSLKAKIEKNPEEFDFLMVDSLEGLKRIFPGFPWKSLACKTFETNNLHACRTFRVTKLKGLKKNLNATLEPGTNQRALTTQGLTR